MYLFYDYLFCAHILFLNVAVSRPSEEWSSKRNI